MTSLENPVYRFADFELEPTERRLRAAGVPVDLPPKVLDTLVFLVQHAGRAVSKDELLRAVWPRGFIDESNLNKHVWLIRRALGDGEHGTRFIETVPKLGFRFVAPVSVTERSATRTVAPAVAIEPLAVVPATPHRMRAAAWSVAAVAIAGIALFALTRHRPLAVMAPPSGRAVAIASFRNLSQNPKDAWLGPALTAMLGTELSVANRLRVVPEALVRDVHVEATASGAGGYAPAALQRFHDAVGADYVVVGTYLVSGTADDAPVRVDVAVQDARSGATVVAISRQDPLSSLLGVVKQAGVQLRAGLAAGDTDAAALQQLANAQPPSAAIARRVGFALEALQHYDAARARDELLDAIAEAPGYAPAYRALARAWMMLGYRDKAIAAGEQAMSRAANLPSAERLEIDAVLQTTRNAWPAAAARWRELVALRPAVPEYRLELIDALLAVGNVVAAQAALAELRMLGSSGADPRVELADARIAHARDNSRDAASHAAAALRLSQQQGTESLAADAHLELATAHLQLGELDEARTDANAAIDAYRRVGNPSGEATGLQLLGSAFDDSNHQQQAREAYQRALALDQGIGDLSGIGEIYKDLCSMLWVAGDRDGAQAAARKGLAISREIANVTLEAWTTRALATIAADESASDSVVEDYRRVEQLGERSSNHGGHVWTLVTLADVERLRGELDAASRDCEQAKAEAASISDEQFRMYADFTCAVLDIDRGQPQPAQRALVGSPGTELEFAL